MCYKKSQVKKHTSLGQLRQIKEIPNLKTEQFCREQADFFCIREIHCLVCKKNKINFPYLPVCRLAREQLCLQCQDD